MGAAQGVKSILPGFGSEEAANAYLFPPVVQAKSDPSEEEENLSDKSMEATTTLKKVASEPELIEPTQQQQIGSSELIEIDNKN